VSSYLHYSRIAVYLIGIFTDLFGGVFMNRYVVFVFWVRHRDKDDQKNDRRIISPYQFELGFHESLDSARIEFKKQIAPWEDDKLGYFISTHLFCFGGNGICTEVY
jgi:hypothetical protein